MHTTFETFLYEAIDAIPRLKISDIVRKEGVTMVYVADSQTSNATKMEGQSTAAFGGVGVSHSKIEDRGQIKSRLNITAKALRCSLDIGEVPSKKTLEPVPWQAFDLF